MNGSKPIRIAQVVGKMNGGGVESVVMNYYRHINHEKIQFDFIVDADSKLVPKMEIENWGGRVILVPPYQKTVLYHKELVSIFRREQYLIVHSHLNALSVFPLFAAKQAGIPVRIAHSHSTAGKGEFSRNIMKYTLRPFSKLFATHYCACTNYAGKWLFGKTAVDNGQVRIIRNAIDIKQFIYNEQERRIVREELGLENELVVGHIGRFMYQKNHFFLIQVFCEILKRKHDSILLLVGQGPLEEETRALVRNQGIENNVRFLGQRNDVSRLYQAMDLFLFPSFYEGLGVVCIEAQAAGLPCLVSDRVPKETDLFGTVRFIPLEASAFDWSDAALRIVEESGKRNDCKALIQRAGYDITDEAKKLEDMYTILTNKKNDNVQNKIS